MPARHQGPTPDEPELFAGTSASRDATAPTPAPATDPAAQDPSNHEIDPIDTVGIDPVVHLAPYDAKAQGVAGQFRSWFLDYSSYVILERAVPHIDDGLKPVQRRILHVMWEMEDGRYNKVANIIGNAMKYHPHGDAAIGEAIVGLGQKELLIDTQGNWGNILTGDNSAAPRYIEARLVDQLRRSQPRASHAAHEIPAAPRPRRRRNRRRPRLQNAAPQFPRIVRRLHRRPPTRTIHPPARLSHRWHHGRRRI